MAVRSSLHNVRSASHVQLVTGSENQSGFLRLSVGVVTLQSRLVEPKARNVIFGSGKGFMRA